MSRILTLQKNAMSIINFRSRNTHSSPLFLELKLIKFNNKVLYEKVLLISKFIKNLLPPAFNNWFTFRSNIHNYETISSTTCKPFKLFSALTYINTLNEAQTSLGNTILKDLTPNKIKQL